MKLPFLSSVIATGLFVAFTASNAGASSLADCANIDVEANANCEAMASGGCSVDSCTPIACSASLYAQCKGNCSVPNVSCEGTCKADCSANCQAKGKIDCTGDCSVRCNGSCSGDCTAQCQTSSDKTNCQAKCEGTCKASCQGECNAKCTASGSASCDVACQGSCQGSCTVKGNLACHMDCRATGEAKCTGGCEIACEQPNAALFCDGQYIDNGGHLASCTDALKKLVGTIKVDATADGSAACNNGTCTAEGSASANASCAMAKFPNASNWLGLGLLGVVTSGLVMRRRQRQRA